MEINWFWLKTINNNAIKYTLLTKRWCTIQRFYCMIYDRAPSIYLECVASWSPERSCKWRCCWKGEKGKGLSCWYLHDTMWGLVLSIFTELYLHMTSQRRHAPTTTTKTILTATATIITNTTTITMSSVMLPSHKSQVTWLTFLFPYRFLIEKYFVVLTQKKKQQQQLSNHY